MGIRDEEEIEMMLERLLDVEATEYGTIIEEIELLCCMTGFRRRFLVEHTVDGLCRSVEVFWRHWAEIQC